MFNSCQSRIVSIHGTYAHEAFEFTVNAIKILFSGCAYMTFEIKFFVS